jgi:hypothetical protein
MRVVWSKGFSSKSYSRNFHEKAKVTEGCRAAEECHTWITANGHYLAFNADYWRETAQRAWLGEVGTPGGISLFEGARHGEYAAQVAAEYLEYKVELPNGRTDYRWRQVGKNNFGDSTTMCYALAGSFGISASGYIPPGAKAAPRSPKMRYVFKRGRYIR